MVRIDDTVKDRASLGLGVACLVWFICAIAWVSAMFIAWDIIPMPTWVLRLMFVAGFIFGVLSFLFPDVALDDASEQNKHRTRN